MSKLKLPKLYLSGFRPTLAAHKDKNWEYELEFIRRSKLTHRCLNFAYIYPGAFYYQKKMEEMYRACLHEKINIMMDSSAFSFWMFMKNQSGAISKSKKVIDDKQFNKMKDKVIDQYVDFCKSDGKKWDWYANFDYRKDCEIIWKMQLELEKKGLKPTPIFHGDSSLDYFKRYCDRGHKTIAIGGAPKKRGHVRRRRFFERLFRIADDYKVGLHGFAFASIASLTEFPWESVDMSTWAKTAAYGMILTSDRDRSVLRSVHISDRPTTNKITYNTMPKSVQREIEEEVENNGFDFQKLRDSKTGNYERCIYNAWYYSHLDKFIHMVNNKANWEVLI